LLDETAATQWRERRAALHDTAGYLCHARHQRVIGAHLDPFAGASVDVDDKARRALLDMARETLALPLMSYGKPLGHLCLMRHDGAFKVGDLHWLHDAMRELLPLLERSDLLEQLQRETAAAERERIGRDLHDSAVQPYLGLKYGLEALARQGRCRQCGCTADSAADRAHDAGIADASRCRERAAQRRRPDCNDGVLDALRRQASRFEALYGLKVHIGAHEPVHLRGSIAKTLLHMFNEALTNVRRHTTARTVTVLLEVHADRLMMCVRNDIGTRSPREKAFTPRSLSERATEVGGTVTVRFEQDFTEVAIALPTFKALA
jgi:signal transduction histidine kinase